ncbi:extensin [Iris pallida]|uniref:Extensin n=1 Tax=Iris pallida TaxID=29817 RepID=A0AAX6FUP6_IRIPA|nr:extensin [Iris pallida]
MASGADLSAREVATVGWKVGAQGAVGAREGCVNSGVGGDSSTRGPTRSSGSRVRRRRACGVRRAEEFWRVALSAALPVWGPGGRSFAASHRRGGTGSALRIWRYVSVVDTGLVVGNLATE